MEGKDVKIKTGFRTVSSGAVSRAFSDERHRTSLKIKEITGDA